jgi:hypothetical protein
VKSGTEGYHDTERSMIRRSSMTQLKIAGDVNCMFQTAACWGLTNYGSHEPRRCPAQRSIACDVAVAENLQRF